MEKNENSEILSDSELALCASRAAINWMEWQDCFEYRGHPTKIPVLHDKDRFFQFTQKYNLRWLGNRNDRDDFRLRLRESTDLMAAVTSHNASEIDKCVGNVMANNGKRQLSAISKIATFLDSEHFLPIDRFAKNGLRKLGAKPIEFRNYDSYLNAVRRHTEPRLRALVLKKIEQTRLPEFIENHNGFYLRVLDTVLMKIGGRWPE